MAHPLLKTLRSMVGAALLVSATTCGGDDTTGQQLDWGSVTINVRTTGTDFPVGYMVHVATQSQGVAPNGTVFFNNVPTSRQTVSMSNIPSNCTTEQSSQSVTVPPGGTVIASFTFTCVGNIGSVSVTTTTGGTDPDDGFAVSIDAGAGTAIGANETITIPDLAVAGHSVELTGVATNCTVAGDNPRNVIVTFGSFSAATTFDVTCT